MPVLPGSHTMRKASSAVSSCTFAIWPGLRQGSAAGAYGASLVGPFFAATPAALPQWSAAPPRNLSSGRIDGDVFDWGVTMKNHISLLLSLLSLPLTLFPSQAGALSPAPTGS